MYIKLTNGIPEIYSIGNLRRDNPNVSFPANPTLTLLAEWDVYPCSVKNPTGKEELSHRLVEDRFELVNNEWVLHKKYEELPLEQASSNIRDKRNELLSQSDWTQTIDAKVDQAAWANYRQQLRDISAQPTFPYLVSWPFKPE